MSEPSKRSVLKETARAALPAAVSFGLGYGIARTALEHMVEKGTLSLPVRRFAPLLLGAGAAYAGTRADKALREHAESEARKKSR